MIRSMSQSSMWTDIPALNGWLKVLCGTSSYQYTAIHMRQSLFRDLEAIIWTARMQICWILQSIIDESRSTPRATAVRSLLDACKESAVTPSVNRAALPDSRRYDLGECMRDSCQEGHPEDVPAHVDKNEPESLLQRARHTARFSRLQSLQNELGQGEGVSALVQASLQDLDAGGDGVVAPVAGGVLETHQALEVLKKPMHQFQATVHFFDALCNCGRGLVNLAKERRHSLLRQRLETCNALLFTDEMMCQVCFFSVGWHGGVVMKHHVN